MGDGRSWVILFWLNHPKLPNWIGDSAKSSALDQLWPCSWQPCDTWAALWRPLQERRQLLQRLEELAENECGNKSLQVKDLTLLDLAGHTETLLNCQGPGFSITWPTTSHLIVKFPLQLHSSHLSWITQLELCRPVSPAPILHPWVWLDW